MEYKEAQIVRFSDLTEEEYLNALFPLDGKYSESLTVLDLSAKRFLEEIRRAEDEGRKLESNYSVDPTSYLSVEFLVYLPEQEYPSYKLKCNGWNIMKSSTSIGEKIYRYAEAYSVSGESSSGTT